MNEKKITFDLQGETLATLHIDQDQKIYLSSLFDLPCGMDRSNSVPKAVKGLMTIKSSIGDFSTDELSLTEQYSDETSASLVFGDSNEHIRVETHWTFCPNTGVCSRKDVIQNIADQSINLSRCLARFVFTPANYEMFSQAGSWCAENQGHWRCLDHGTVTLRNEAGRTTQGGTPYMCLRNTDTAKAVAFHIIPRGNWVIKASCYTADSYSKPFLMVELGLDDDQLNLTLKPGKTVELPEILMQSVPQGHVENAAPYLHQFLLENHFKSAKPWAPVIYNTWFDVFEILHIERLRKQLQAAKTIGCEVFVVDAGWYGPADTDWYQQAGDWREKTNDAFRGKMAQFADEVRKNGLQFGLWMEPERNGAATPALKNNPDWFLKGTGDFYYPDLSNQHAYDYIVSEISRLVETYQLAWMKIDFNFKLGKDIYAREFADYYQKWYQLLDELRETYPQVFFEGCASGGMRLDINTLCHFDGHFLSDNVNPADMLRMNQQALLRVIPGRLTKWITLRSVGTTIAQYGHAIDQTPTRFVTPAGCGATWEKAQTVDIDFAARTAFAGMMGFSGDIAGLTEQAKDRLRYHTELYKKWREWIVGSVAHLLTPVTWKHDHTGWIAMQFNHRRTKRSLLFVYRLDDASSEKMICLKGLDHQAEYAITVEHESSSTQRPLTGGELMEQGLKVTLPQRDDAAIILIEPQH